MDIGGIEVADLPEGAVPLEIVLSMKVMSDDGIVSLVERASRGVAHWEALGMAVTLCDSLRAGLMSSRD